MLDFDSSKVGSWLSGYKDLISVLTNKEDGPRKRGQKQNGATHGSSQNGATHGSSQNGAENPSGRREKLAKSESTEV